MIYTVTLNPALDYVLYPDTLKTGSINNSTKEAVFCGGKGINVSVMLKNLGVPSAALGFIAGFTGDEIEKRVKEKGIYTDFIRLKTGMSRINVKLRTDTETDINSNGPAIPEEALKELYNKLDRLKSDDILVLAGSIHKGLPSDTYEKLLRITAKNNVRAVVDARGEVLTNTLKYKPFLIKPNFEELCEIFSVSSLSIKQAIGFAEELRKSGALNVMVSLGGKGAFLIDEYGEKHFCSAPSGKAVNTVGAWDSAVAGFIAAAAENKGYGYALKSAVCAGSATAFSEGLGSYELVKGLENGVQSVTEECFI